VDQILAMIVGLVVVVALLVAPLVLLVVAFLRSRRVGELLRRVERLEALVLDHARPVAAVEVRAEADTPPAVAPMPVAASAGRRREVAPAIDWEWFLGRRALGWVAVVLVVFAGAFFLKYAIENRWIGPLGRVALAAASGIALAVGGRRYAGRGWRVASQMMTAAGVVLLYLAAYAAFGFYHLLPQGAAAVFLVLIVAESATLAILYDAPALALAAVLGGLLTPVLMDSEHDQYGSLFTYLAVLDAGVVLLAVRRSWPAFATVALLGTQGLFWAWYFENDHPEKLGAAVGFQLVVWALFLGQGLVAHLLRACETGREDLARWLANATLGFVALYVLLDPGHHAWMGTLALVAAAAYAAVGRLLLAGRPGEGRLFLTTLAVAVGFVAAAFPIQADSHWIALGWAAEAAALWWFGLRVRAPVLRGLSAALAAMAVVRLAAVDTPDRTRAPFVPIFNGYALPALGVVACLLVGVAATRRLRAGLGAKERSLAAAAEVVGALLLWLVLSVDLDGYFRARAATGGADGPGWARLGQMSLSMLWAAYATGLLAVGFRSGLARLRWTALGLYGLTVGKVFLLDMAALDEIYRISAFLVLAVLLGVAARIYQPPRPAPVAAGIEKGAGP